MALIDFYIRNQKLTKIGPKLVADSINYVNCSFTFKTPDWFGIDKWVVFSKGDEAYRVNLVEDKIPKEAGLNLGAGLWNVSLFGENSSGTERITTNSVTVEVAKSTVQDGEPLPPIALSEAEQIAAKAERAIETANEVKRKAEDGEFNGKPGEPGKDGENATPEQIAEAVENYFEENPIPGGGSGGEVTAESIEEALGYLPANPSDIPTDNKDLANGAGYVKQEAIEEYAQPKGNYALKEEIPTVPKKISELENDADYAKKSELPKVPSKVSELDNDVGYLKDFTEEDPTVPAWAKEPTKPSYDKSEVGLENVANERQYSAQNPPPYPVAKVNNKTGDVQLGADDVGADEAGKAVEEVGKHNVDDEAHNDIRVKLSELQAAIEAFLNIDDTEFDQLSELIEKIRENAGSITELTNGKVNISDIVNDLKTNLSNKPLSAAQGVVLKGLVDSLNTLVSGAKTTADEAKTAAQNAGTTATEAKNLAQSASQTATNASDKVNGLERRMNDGEFDGKDGVSPVLDLLDTEYNALTTEQKIAHYESGKRLISVKEASPNLVPNAISENGAIFNGCGYMNGYRLNSSGAIVEAEQAVVTGYMPYEHGKTIEITGGTSNPSSGGQYVATYDNNFNLLYVGLISYLIENSNGTSSFTEENISIYSIKTAALASTTVANGFKNAKYIRVSVNPCIGKQLKVKCI